MFFVSSVMSPVLGYFSSNPRPKWNIYKHESDKNKKFLSVGNYRNQSVARLQPTPAYECRSLYLLKLRYITLVYPNVVRFLIFEILCLGRVKTLTWIMIYLFGNLYLFLRKFFDNFFGNISCFREKIRSIYSEIYIFFYRKFLTTFTEIFNVLERKFNSFIRKFAFFWQLFRKLFLFYLFGNLYFLLQKIFDNFFGNL